MRVPFLSASVDCDPVARCTSRSLIAFSLVVPLVVWLVKDCFSRLEAPGKVSRGLVEPLGFLRGPFQLDSEVALVELRRLSPPSGVPRYWELHIRGGCPRNLEIVGESRTSTLNERTRS